MTVAADQATVANRIDTLLHEIAAAPTVARARERSEELARALVELYGSALERILTIVHETAGERNAAIFAALCEDRSVESLLVLHDLHPLSLEDRVRAALNSVRPYLESHAGGIEVVAVADGIAHLRLEGTCDGCPSSAATVKLAVERAILDRIHEVSEVRVENVTPARPNVAPRDITTTLRLETDWIALEAFPALITNRLAHLSIGDTSLLLINVDEQFYAYRNYCPTCRRPFSDASVIHSLLRCSACGHGFDVRHAGRAQDGAPLYAEPFPLERDGGRVRVALPVGA